MKKLSLLASVFIIIKELDFYESFINEAWSDRPKRSKEAAGKL